MKLNKLVLPLTLPLVLLLATTGCPRKSNVGVTKIPVHSAGPTGGHEQSPQITSAPPIEPPTPPPVVTTNATGGYPTADINLPDYTQEPLSAYTVHFKFDSAAVENSEQANIASVAQSLSDQHLKLLIEGHCDERGTEEYNRSLGERRALALREALAKINVDPMRIKTESFGKDKPVDPGHDEAAWSKNRRGEFILLHPKNPAP
jgi:peptidoglycan-associated lipoprotein